MYKQIYSMLAYATAIGGLGLVAVGCSGTAPSAHTVSNGDVEHQIEAQYASRPPLSRLRVSANVDKSEVTVTGTVASEEDRSQAVNIVKQARPGYAVTDKIDVKPPEVSRADYTADMAERDRAKGTATGDKIGKSVDDAWIHTKITTKLMTDKDTPSRKINVDVNNKVVTLRGTVDDVTAKAEAERIAKETDGVKHVVNRLTVRSS
jgi:hyperosmotically inducible periplasmic protein